MNDKGQALIEFVIILPVILFILLYIIDFSIVTMKKFELESDMNTVLELIENNKQEDLNNYIINKNININYSTNNNLTTITITKKTKYNMPLLKDILGDTIKTKRIIYNEQ